MSTETPNPEHETRASDRLVRFAALAIAGFTLVWLSGCGEPVDTKAVQQQREQQAAAEEAALQAKLNEGPTSIVLEDFPRIENKDDVNAMRGATSQALLRTKGQMKLVELNHNLTLFGQNPDVGYPKSHEAFVKLMTDNGLSMPELKEPYEVWYNAETHEIMKRPKKAAEDESSKADSPAE